MQTELQTVLTLIRLGAVWSALFAQTYEGQSINTDNGSISQNILLESELSSMQNVDMGVALFMCEIWCFYHYWIWCYEYLYITL